MMNFEYINTERLRLRKITPEVYAYVFAEYTNEEQKSFFGFNTDAELEKERGKFEKGISTFNKSFVLFQLIDKASQKIIGSCGFHTWYTDHDRAEIGYALTRDDFKGKGMMTEALAPIIQYGFERMNLNRVEAFISPGNEPSLKLVAKLNFVPEGMLRQDYFKDGKHDDSLIFSLLHSEYRQQVGNPG